MHYRDGQEIRIGDPVIATRGDARTVAIVADTLATGDVVLAEPVPAPGRSAQIRYERTTSASITHIRDMEQSRIEPTAEPATPAATPIEQGTAQASAEEPAAETNPA